MGSGRPLRAPRAVPQLLLRSPRGSGGGLGAWGAGLSGWVLWEVRRCAECGVVLRGTPHSSLYVVFKQLKSILGVFSSRPTHLQHLALP